METALRARALLLAALMVQPWQIVLAVYPVLWAVQAYLAHLGTTAKKLLTSNGYSSTDLSMLICSSSSSNMS